MKRPWVAPSLRSLYPSAPRAPSRRGASMACRWGPASDPAVGPFDGVTARGYVVYDGHGGRPWRAGEGTPDRVARLAAGRPALACNGAMGQPKAREGLDLDRPLRALTRAEGRVLGSRTRGLPRKLQIDRGSLMVRRVD